MSNPVGSELTSRRRTQAERRATTQEALLEATIRVLVARGYNGMTTADVAKEAGVTRGAQAHHFGSKADLVAKALRHLANRLISEYESMVPTQAPGSDVPIDLFLDSMWSLHRSDLFTAAFELWLAARTDAELRVALRELDALVLRQIGSSLGTVLPSTIGRSEAMGLLSTTMATMRGLAMLTFVQDDVEREWRAARGLLLQSWEVVLAMPSSV